MNKLINQYLFYLTVFAVLLANAAFGYAQGLIPTSILQNQIDNEITVDFEDESQDQRLLIGNTINNTVDEELNKIPRDNEKPDDQLSDEEKKALEENLEFLDRLKQELNLSKTDYHQLLTNISDTQDHLNKVTEETASLELQITSLDSLIVDTTEKLISIISQIIETENEISLLYEQIEIREIALNYQKILLEDYVKIIYLEEKSYFSQDEDGSLNAFKLLLADDSVGDHLKELRYFDLLNETGIQILDRLDEINDELALKKQELNEKKDLLIVLETEVFAEKTQLEFQKEAKENLLALTRGQEEIYTQLLEQTIEEQGSVVEDIRTLNNVIYFIEKELDISGAEFDPEKYEEFLDYRNKAIYDFHLRYRGLNPDGFDWPVDPIKGISAYFRDASYVGVFGVGHNAIDIPVYQGTPLRAAADGVVYSAKDNGYGYSYVILLHANGLSTVYGHVSKIFVKEGDTLAKGAIIAASGGMPGTKGAGYMTTGPHLHFEVHLNGQYTDPLYYLPLEILSEEQIKALPDKYFDDWEKAVLGKNADAVKRF